MLFCSFGTLFGRQNVPQNLPKTFPRLSKMHSKLVKNPCRKKVMFWSLFLLFFFDFRFQNPLSFGSNLDAFCDYVKSCQDQQSTAWAHEFWRSAFQTSIKVLTKIDENLHCFWSLDFHSTSEGVGMVWESQKSLIVQFVANLFDAKSI